MATKIVTKNSSTASAVPTASDLVQGELAVNVADKRLFTEDNAGAIVELGTNPSGNVTFQDNGKAIFGAGSDLQIYHDATNSYIDSNTGRLYVTAASSIRLTNSDNTENYARFNEDGSVQLYYDNVQKFATTSSGIDVTGTATMDGLTVNSGATSTTVNFQNSGTAYSTLYNDTNGVVIFSADAGNTGAAPRMQFNVGGQQAFRITDGGDISFYEDTGTTPKFFWDASAESLGIGTTTPARLVDLKDSSNVDGARLRLRSAIGIDTVPTIGSVEFYSEDNSTNSSGIVGSIDVEGIGTWNGASNNAAMTFNLIQGLAGTTSPIEAMRIDSAGNLLVGKTTTAVTTGCDMRPTGNIVASASADNPLYLNRSTNDGDIAVFAKDGTSVGSIGTEGGQAYISGTSNGLHFNGATIRPSNSSGVAVDNTADLGQSAYRFKDLYLSGDVVLGAADGYVFGNTNGVNIRAASGKSTIFDTAGTERMRIDSSGLLKIGTSGTVTPYSLSKFAIDTGTYAYMDLLSTGSSGINFGDAGSAQRGTIEYNHVSDYMRFGSAGAERMRIDSSGNVGIGESNPQELLHLTATTPVFRMQGGSRTYQQFVSGTDFVIRDVNAGLNRVTLDSSGNLLVGKTNTSIGAVGHTLTSNGEAYHTRSGGVALYLNRQSSFGNVTQFYQNNDPVGSISVTSTATSYNTSSDYRLKENVVELTGATERLKQLNPSRFNFIADADTTVDGFLAHEVADVVPEAIVGEKDAVDADGNPEYQGIDQSKLVPLLVATIQELEARITQLENN